MNFKQTVDVILEFEGGYVNHPHDKGGPTNFGITHDTFIKAQKLDIIDPKLTGVDQITKQDAIDIYREMYWEDRYLKIDEVNAVSEPLALAMFDFSVISGRPNAVKELQNTLCVMNDAKVGDDTIAAIKSYDGDIVSDYFDSRLRRHERKAEEELSQKGFSKGWESRVANLKDYIAQEFGQIQPQEGTPTSELAPTAKRWSIPEPDSELELDFEPKPKPDLEPDM